MALARELEVARRLALEAGALALRLRTAGLAVERKGGGEPVTEADRAANALIVAGLGAAFPADAVLSEELPADPARLAAPRLWIVDPIDGTRDFIAGRPGFAVMIGLSIAGGAALGVVFEPATGALAWGAPGQGAFEERPAGAAARSLAVSAVSRLEDARFVSSFSHRTPLLDELRAALGVVDDLAIGSVGVKAVRIARGERDLYVNPSSRSSLWDVCAPEAILAAAGGRVTDLDGRPFDYRALELRNLRGLVASNGGLHDETLARIAPVLAAHGR